METERKRERARANVHVGGRRDERKRAFEERKER